MRLVVNAARQHRYEVVTTKVRGELFRGTVAEEDMAELGVNIDHVATVRQARRTYEPDPVAAAVLAELGGADTITVHLREDRRHIQDRDLRVLRETVAVKLNLELACADAMLDIAIA